MLIRFGTDGLRGPSGLPPVDTHTASLLGRCLAELCPGSRVAIARDTRTSGPPLAAALTAGIQAGSSRAIQLGVLPTPALSVLLARGAADRGIMITASHNPPEDNGLKVLGPDGRKLDDTEQASLELRLNELNALGEPDPDPAPAQDIQNPEAVERYLEALQAALETPDKAPLRLRGLRVAVDASHGAGSFTLPEILRRLGAEPIPMACTPDGARINVGCGSLHPERLVELVRAERAQAGIAIDGDGDRCTLVSASGRVLDGDALLYLLAEPPAVVGTIMSNSGLEAGLARRGITLCRSAVGDRNVESMMRLHDLRVGAEPSGHVCFSNAFPTADGTLTALRVLAGGLDLDARLADHKPFPSRLVNLRVERRLPLDQGPVAAALESIRADLAPHGRALLRYSGTEPLVRILTEGPDESRVAAASAFLVHILKMELGSP